MEMWVISKNCSNDFLKQNGNSIINKALYGVKLTKDEINKLRKNAKKFLNDKSNLMGKSQYSFFLGGSLLYWLGQAFLSLNDIDN